jgi:hypothetical protein
VLLTPFDCLDMPTNTTFRNSCGGCDSADALLAFLSDVLKDFLTPFLYIEIHRSLGLVHQGTILDLVFTHRVFLCFLYNQTLNLSRFTLYPSQTVIDFALKQSGEVV